MYRLNLVDVDITPVHRMLDQGHTLVIVGFGRRLQQETIDPLTYSVNLVALLLKISQVEVELPGHSRYLEL